MKTSTNTADASRVGSTGGSTPAYPMREWLNRIRTTFNDGSFFEGNEVQHALVVSFTAPHRGGVKKTEILEREMIVDWDEYDRQQAASPNTEISNAGRKPNNSMIIATETQPIAHAEADSFPCCSVSTGSAYGAESSSAG